jgi:hypothetical protein
MFFQFLFKTTKKEIKYFFKIKFFLNFIKFFLLQKKG